MTLFTVTPRLSHAALLLALFASACIDSPMEPVFSDDESYAVTSDNVEIVTPGAATTVVGVTTFTARLTDRAIGSYKMTWRVDGGSAVRMSKSGGYDIASVDVATWNWNGAGPYKVTFTASELVNGVNTIVGRRTINIYVATSSNPFAAASFFVDPYSNAMKTAKSWRASRPLDAAEMDKIALQPQADWFGSWNSDIFQAVNARTTLITNARALPVFVAYNIPFRDCGGFSSGGASSPEAYRAWITNFANGIGTRKAVVVLEPDALAALGCLSAANQQVRMELLAFAVKTLKAKGGIAVYIDAGHSRWQSAATMIARLKTAGIGEADGFSLNVSNFIASPELRTYGEQISAGVSGKHFIIDTSRNGQGSNGEWCNPSGRGIGAKATANTGAPLVDAFFWIKRPGESDGSCNGAPAVRSRVRRDRATQIDRSPTSTLPMEYFCLCTNAEKRSPMRARVRYPHWLPSSHGPTATPVQESRARSDQSHRSIRVGPVPECGGFQRRRTRSSHRCLQSATSQARGLAAVHAGSHEADVRRMNHAPSGRIPRVMTAATHRASRERRRMKDHGRPTAPGHRSSRGSRVRMPE